MGKQLNVMDKELTKVKENVFVLTEKVYEMDETLQEVRSVTNRLLEWSDEVGSEIGVKI